MKLIDILVQELPKRGGWPKGAVECCRYTDEANIDFYDKDGNWPHDCYSSYGPIAEKIIIQRKKGEMNKMETVGILEYEAALAESKLTAWDGEGLPPAGCECEIRRVADWMPVTIRFISDYHTIFKTFGGTEDCYQTCSLQFRPIRIRTEAERRREEAINKIQSHCQIEHHSPISASQAIALYQAIAAGKIPGVRLTDAAGN